MFPLSAFVDRQYTEFQWEVMGIFLQFLGDPRFVGTYCYLFLCNGSQLGYFPIVAARLRVWNVGRYLVIRCFLFYLGTLVKHGKHANIENKNMTPYILKFYSSCLQISKAVIPCQIKIVKSGPEAWLIWPFFVLTGLQ